MAENTVFWFFQSRKFMVEMPLGLPLGVRSRTRTTCSGWSKGRGFSSTASMKLKIAVFAPMPESIAQVVEKVFNVVHAVLLLALFLDLLHSTQRAQSGVARLFG